MALGSCVFRAGVVAWALASGLLPLSVTEAVGQSSNGADKDEAGPKTFLGAKIKPKPGIYLVTKDVNVRARPETKSKRVGRFRKGARITTVGKATGAWVAVKKDGKDYGFVYEPILLEIIDGALKKPQSGTLKEKGRPNCTYKIQYEGKSAAEGQLFEIADYAVDWDCEWKDKVLRFVTPMFMTEAASRIAKKQVHQITIDIISFEASMEEVVSTTVLYERTKSRVLFDGVSEDRFARKAKFDEFKVDKLADALDAAVWLTYRAWNEAVWTELAKAAN